MSTTAASYRGLYINLDRSQERRTRMEAQLAHLGLTEIYARLAATDGATLTLTGSNLRPGEVGLFHSHTQALEEARGFGTAAHIVEDDTLFSEHVRPVIEDAIAAHLFESFDIVFTDMLVECHVGLLKGFKAAFDRALASASRPLRLADLQVLDLKGRNFACSSSFIVGRNAIDRVYALCRQEIATGLRLPFDLFLRSCVSTGKLRAACIVPFVTSFEFDEIANSTIAGGEARPSVAVMAALRYSFYVERNLAYATAQLNAGIGGVPPPDAHRELIARAIDFVLSDEFKEF